MNKVLEYFEYLKNFINHLYDYPGIYKMFDERKKLLYIGKAKNLKTRLSDYLNFDSLTPRIKEMVLDLKKIEIIITKTEIDALVLEAQLIRSLKPKYNILLKNLQTYNFIFLDDEKYKNFPSFKIFKTRNLQEGEILNKKIFGPFFSSFQVKQILDLISSNFGIRSCQDSFFKNHLSKSKTCIQFEIGKCFGPCIAKENDEINYLENLSDSLNFLKGNTKILLKNLNKKMEEASLQLNFESAILYREKIKALKNFYNKEFLGNEFDGDYIVFLHQETLLTITKNRIFAGQNHGSITYFFENISKEKEFFETIQEFLIQAFLELKPLNHVYCNLMPQNSEEILISTDSKKIDFVVPLKGKKRKIIDDMLLNSVELAKLRLNKFKNNFHLIEKIKIWLNIENSKKIEKIEIFDNSHIMGNFSVGAVVSFCAKEGFSKKDYRVYNIKSTNLPDDYQMLREVFFKRFPKHQLPDLLIIDGGLAHLKVAKNVIFQIYGKDFDNFEIISIAKGQKRNDGLETIFLKDESSVRSLHEDPKIHFIQRLRDEAHRFGIKKHKELRKKKFLQ